MKKLDIVLPVLNEENVLKKNVMKLYKFMLDNLSYVNWKIVIVDNGSSDSTQFLGEGLSRENPQIQYIRLEKRGRGRALKKSWSTSQANVVSYMDIDLSTDLRHLPELISSILYDNYDLAIDFYNRESDNFNDIVKKKDALELIESTKDGVKITEYLRLFK